MIISHPVTMLTKGMSGGAGKRAAGHPSHDNLSRLVEAVLDGEEVFLTNRDERVAQLAAAPEPRHAHRGLWKGKANLYSGWDSPEADKDIERIL